MNQEDREFLKVLQQEMLTQDTVCQANPRFWVVEGTTKEYGYDKDYADGGHIMVDCETIIEDMDSACEWLNNIDKDNDYTFFNSYIISSNGYDEFEDLEEVCEYVQDNITSAVDGSYPYVCYYKNVEKIFQNTMFLTNRECKEHIKRNDYHYPKDAHSYAMTAWRSPQVSRLYEILEKTDWNNINNNIKGDTKT